MSQTQLRSSLTNALSQRSSYQMVFYRITLTSCSALSPGQPDFFLTTALESPKLKPSESAGNEGDLGLIPGWGRSPGEGNDYPLRHSCLGNPMDRGAWQATAQGVAEICTRLSD